MPITSPDPTEIADLFTLTEAVLIQQSTLTGHLPGPAANSVSTKRRKKPVADKAKVAPVTLPTEEAQANAIQNAGPNHRERAVARDNAPNENGQT